MPSPLFDELIGRVFSNDKGKGTDQSPFFLYNKRVASRNVILKQARAGIASITLSRIALVIHELTSPIINRHNGWDIFCLGQTNLHLSSFIKIRLESPNLI